MVYLKSCGGARSGRSAGTLSRFHRRNRRTRCSSNRSRRVEKITAKSRICYKGLDGDRARQWAMRHTKEDLVEFLMQKILESGAIVFEENCIESRYDDIELRATVYVAMPEK